MKKIVFCTLLLTLPPIHAAEKGNLYDAKKFDVAGVKLGMNKNQAISAMTEKLGINQDELKFDKAYMEDNVLKRKIPKYFIYENGSTMIQVSMVAAIPIDEVNPLRVNNITYKTSRTTENMTKMRDAAFQKYGTPTNGIREKDHVSMKYSWCSYDSTIKHNNCFNSIGAKLELTAPSLMLTDPSYLKDIQQYMNDQKSDTMKF